MDRAKTASFILELGLETSPHDEVELNARFEAARQLYNACLDEAKRRLELLRQSKEYQCACKMPKTINGKSNVEESTFLSAFYVCDTPQTKSQTNKERTEAFKALNAKFCFREYDLHLYATKIRNSWIDNHIDSTTAQKIATRAFKAVQSVAFGQAKRVRFKGKNQLKSIEGKTNSTGIRYNEQNGREHVSIKAGESALSSIGLSGQVEWKGLKLKCIIDVNDKVVTHSLSHRVKYCRIVKRIFNGKARFFVQLILEGKPYQKFAPLTTL